MKCQEFQEKVNAYVDGELTDNVEAFEKHLDSCEVCRREYEDILELKSLMNDMPILDLPEGFEETLHEKLVQEKQAPVSILSKYSTQIKWIGSLAAVAIVAISLVNNGFNIGEKSTNTAAFEAYSDETADDAITYGVAASTRHADDTMKAAVTEESIEESAEVDNAMDVPEIVGEAQQGGVSKAFDSSSVTITFSESLNTTYVDKGATFLIKNEATDIEVFLEDYKVKDLTENQNQIRFLVENEVFDLIVEELQASFEVVEYYGEFYGNTVANQEAIIKNQKDFILSVKEDENLKQEEKIAIVVNESKHLECLEEDLEKIKENEGYKSITIIIVKE